MKKWSVLLFSLVMVFLSVRSVFSAQSFYTQGPRDKKLIALTFDDGPGPNTDKVLEILKRYGVKATFFMEGDQVEFRQAIARRVAEAGHEIGNHTYSHISMYAYKKADKEEAVTKEIKKTDMLIQKAAGKVPVLVRMPHGYSKEWVRDWAAKNNYTLVNWTFGCDWVKMPVEKLTADYCRNIQPGAIFLMHDGGARRERTLEMLPRLIEEAQKQGYKIVPVGELLGISAGVEMVKKK